MWVYERYLSKVFQATIFLDLLVSTIAFCQQGSGYLLGGKGGEIQF